MVFTVIQLVLVFLLVILILLQPPESDNLGGFGSAQGSLDSMFTTGSSSSFITKLTVIIATAFIINTILLVGINAKSVHKESIVRKIVDMGKVHNLPAAEHNNEDSIPFNQ